MKDLRQKARDLLEQENLTLLAWAMEDLHP